MQTKSSGTLALYLSLFLAMGLSIAPWPNSIANIMPNWVLLSLMYWCIALPHKVSIGTSWVIGLLVDALSDSLLGQNALIYSIAALFAHKLYLRLRNYRVWQQAIFILVFLLFMQLLSLWISQLANTSANGYTYWYQPIFSAIAWPIMFLLLRLIRRRFNVQ